MLGVLADEPCFYQDTEYFFPLLLKMYSPAGLLDDSKGR